MSIRLLLPPYRMKVFWFFFSKKNAFLPLAFPAEIDRAFDESFSTAVGTTY